MLSDRDIEWIARGTIYICIVAEVILFKEFFGVLTGSVYKSFQYLQKFFEVEVNKWLVTSMLSVLGFLVINGRWRKEKYLESWRRNRDEFFKDLTEVQNRLSLLEGGLGILASANNSAAPDWLDLYVSQKKRIGQLSISSSSEFLESRDVFSTSIFSGEFLKEETVKDMNTIMSIFFSHIDSLDWLVTKSMSNPDTDFIVRSAGELHAVSTELRQLFTRLRFYSNRAEQWYSSIFSLVLVRKYFLYHHRNEVQNHLIRCQYKTRLLVINRNIMDQLANSFRS